MLIPLLIVGAMLAIVVVGAGVFFVVSRDDDDPDPPIAVPTSTGPSSNASQPATTSDMSTILKPTIATAQGNTFTRAGVIRNGSCISRADADLLGALRSNACVQNMDSALYTNTSRTVVTVISILKFTDATAAAAVSDETSEGANPTLLLPPSGSGLPALTRTPPSWTRSWTRSEYVIYAQGYWASGSDPGSRTGTVFNTAGELGVDVANTLTWAN
ncbi:hypothetical protein [Actinomadura rugatobispora]|uniref:Serine/threonine protein kinase n=1 Tax=Actinomadura rugatobispora TaxID=1994 RepID=A0ABW0ZYI2_9ACTN|nr:hypothetical protein GCM10010200_050570 [Actinomadura rugatobispora]